MNIRYVLCNFLFIALLLNESFAAVSIVKMMIVGRNDETWSSYVDLLMKKISLTKDMAPQVIEIEDSTSVKQCEEIGKAHRARSTSDFILIIKSNESAPIQCDEEWGKVNFAFLVFNRGTETATFIPGSNQLAGSSADTVSNSTALIRKMKQIQRVFFYSRIPDDYPFIAERNQRVQRKFYFAIIALLFLLVLALLVILFLASLSRYNNRKLERKKAIENQKKQHAKQHVPDLKNDRSRELIGSEGDAPTEKKEKKNDKSGKSSEKKTDSEKKADNETKEVATAESKMMETAASKLMDTAASRFMETAASKMAPAADEKKEMQSVGFYSGQMEMKATKEEKKDNKEVPGKKPENESSEKQADKSIEKAVGKADSERKP